MSWPARATEAITARARSAVEAMTGQKVTRPAIVPPVKATGADRRMRLAVPGAPALDILYLADHDELRIVDRELAASVPMERELSEAEALQIARKAFDDLSGRKLLDPRQYAWDRADVASTWVGWASRDGKDSGRRRLEYRITLRRVINGIEVANAGARIAVHASGRVSGMRLGGVAVASRMAGEVEEPTGKGRWLGRQVTDDDLQARFAREVVPEKAKPRVAWSRVMYVMPENRRSAVVQPMYVVSYALEFPTEDGESVVSRRRTVGLSLFDPKAKPVDLTPPVRAPAIEKTRKRAAGD